MLAAVLPLWVQIPVAAFAAVGTIAGAVLTIINLDEAVRRILAGSAKVKARLGRS
jgi:hypothetical protein